MENQMKKTNNTYKTFFLKKHPYKKPYLKYQLTLSLQRMKKVSCIYFSFTANYAMKKKLKENNKAKCGLKMTICRHIYKHFDNM